jgi:DNA-binding transcriptional regulator YdaS (Cro superfamily)
MNTLIKKAVDICGSQVALAKAVGKTQKHVWNWMNRDKRVPAEYVLDIEKATNGQVSRHELRPDIYPPEDNQDAA